MTGRPVLHLFARVHDTGPPGPLAMGLIAESSVPTTRWAAPVGLSGLWLASYWQVPILRWDASIGWKREVVDN